MVSPVTVTATGSSSLLSSTFSLPAGYLNVAGRILRLRIGGIFTSAASAGNYYFFLKLGSNVIATTASGVGINPSRTNTSWVWDIDIQTQGTGTSGTLNTLGVNVGGSPTGQSAWQSGVAIGNGTVAGTMNWTSPVTLDLTQAYALDFQLNMSAASSTNTVTAQYAVLQILG